MIAEHDEHAAVEQPISRERRLEVFERAVEEAHGVEIVAERGAFERAELQHLVRVGERLERVMERQRDQPCGEWPRLLLETRHHLLKEIVIVEPPADLLGHLEIGLEQTALKAVGGVHDLPVPEAGLEGDRRERGIAALGQDPRQRGVVIAGKAERDRAVIERQQRRQRRELGVGGAPFARLIGHVGEAEAVAGPTPQVRHHLLAADGEVDHEILERFHLHDDQVLALRGGEAGATGAQRRPLLQPRQRLVDLRGSGRTAQPGAAQVIPGVVGVVAERTELLHHRARAKHLVERRGGEHARGR